MNQSNQEKAFDLMEKSAKKTIKATSYLIRWVFLIILLYIAGSMIWLYYTDGLQSLNTIVTVSIGGFWAFFFGYFGWRLAEIIENHYFRF